MRFLFKDASRVRRLARTLQTELAAHGIDWPLHRCRQVTAEACGYPNFHEAESSAGKAGASLVDGECSVEVARARNRHQRAVLHGSGLSPEIADDVFGKVGFTAPVRRKSSALSVAPRAEPRLTDRQERIRRHAKSSMRAGNFLSHALVDAAGTFIGMAMGTDHATEHDDLPEALLEALQIPETATTVGDGRGRLRMLANLSLALTSSDHPVAVAYVTSDTSRLNQMKTDLRRSDFTDPQSHSMWRRITRLNHAGPLGVISAWSYETLALVGFEPESQKRVISLYTAIEDRNISIAFHRDTGPILLITDRLDPDLRLDVVVKMVRDASYVNRENQERDLVLPLGATATLGMS